MPNNDDKTEIFICPTGSVSAASKRILRARGIALVEADNPGACRFVRSGEEITGTELFGAAMDALNSQTEPDAKTATKQREAFAMAVYELMLSKYPTLKPLADKHLKSGAKR